VKLAIAFLLGMAAAIAIQGRTEDWVIGSGLVRHLSGKEHCNDRWTPGFGVERNGQVYGLAVGIFDNSNCRVSGYVAGSWRPLQLGSWKLGGIAGIVSGYNKTVFPAAGAAASYERKHWGVNVIYLPPIGKESGGVIWLQWKLPW
jgi:hypothetical protein